MADTSGQQDIRGIDIDKLVKGFADEEIIMKNFVQNSTTSAREIRWYQKTSGFLSGTTTSGITADLGSNVAEKALPSVIEQSFTRNTSYVRKYFYESPWISEEDIKDSDVDILATNIRDVVRAVANQVDTRIINVLFESFSAANINSFATTSIGGDQWDAASYAADVVKDLNRAIRLIRDNSYQVEGNGVLLLDPTAHESMKNWLISGKGSSIPQFASEKISSGVVMEILGLQVVVSIAMTTDYAGVFVRNRAATWKSFMPITSAVKVEEGIGRKIRVWEEGEAILTDPKAVTLITDINT